MENQFVKVDHFKPRFHNFRIVHCSKKDTLVTGLLGERLFLRPPGNTSRAAQTNAMSHLARHCCTESEHCIVNLYKLEHFSIFEEKEINSESLDRCDKLSFDPVY